MKRPEILPDLRANLQKQLIGHLVDYSLELEEFQQITSSLDLSEHELAKKYRAFGMSMEQHLTERTSVERIQEVIQQLNALSNSLRASKIPLPDWIISLEVGLHWSAGRFYLQTEQPAKGQAALDAFSRAEELLTAQNLPENQKDLLRIRKLKEKALRLINRA